MSFLGDIAKNVGNFTDDVGTNFNLPEIGLSEFYAGGNRTSNTGRIDYDKDLANFYGGATGNMGYGTISDAAFHNASMQPTGQEILGEEDQKEDPTSPSGDTGTGLGVGTGGGGTSYSASDLAYLDDQIKELQRQQGRYDSTLNQGLTSLGDSYNKQLSRQNQSRSRALENFGVQRSDTEMGKNQAIGQVDTNARTLADSVRRLLGLSGGTDSSAYNIAAPNAVARQATQQRSGVLSDYGQNFRDLGMAENRAKTDFEQLLDDLLEQRNQRESSLRSGVLEGKNQISTQLADAAREKQALLGGGYDQARQASQGYVDDIQRRESALDNLFNQFRTPYNVQDVNVQTPELRDYTVDRAAINANRGGQQSPYAPYAQLLRRQEEEEQR